jgi:putative membrane protein
LVLATLATIVLVLGAVPSVRAQEERLPLDKEFVMQAAQGGLAEVRLSEIAQQRATTAAIKKFAQQMVTDHTRLNKEITDLAGKEGINIPKEVDAKHRTHIEKLSKLSGNDFEREYMQHQVMAHEKAVEMFRHQAKSGQDEQIKALATKALPILEGHLRQARDLAK